MKKILFVVAVMFVSSTTFAYAQTNEINPYDTTAGIPTGSTGGSTGAPSGAFTADGGVSDGFVPLAPIPGLTDPTSATSAINSDNLASFFNNLYKYLIGLAAVLAVIEIIWGGLEISTKDSVSKQKDGKERITQAILGLILVLSPVLVFSIINPAILNLSLSLPKLDTAPNQGTNALGSCDPATNSDNTSCRQQLVDQCTNNKGGTPQQTYDPVSGKTTVTCITSGPLAPNSSMSTDDCVGQATNGNGLVFSTTKTCSTLSASELNGKSCRNISTGGVCLW